jgi:hypothetical protein
MQCEKPRAKGWGRPNQVRNAMEKIFGTNLEKRITRQTNNHAPAPSLSQDLKRTQCEICCAKMRPNLPLEMRRPSCHWT